MWWRDLRRQWRRPARLLLVLAAAGLTAGCWEPLYGTRPSVGSEGVQDKFAAVEIPPIVAPKGTPAERIAVGMFNALQFDLHNGAGASTTVSTSSAGTTVSTSSAAYRLVVNIATSQFTAVIDSNTGRPNANIASVSANYQLVEIATGKTVVSDNTHAHVDYDIPGSEQRFAAQRGRRDAEDRAIQVVAQAIRNRLASYFVAGT